MSLTSVNDLLEASPKLLVEVLVEDRLPHAFTRQKGTFVASVSCTDVKWNLMSLEPSRDY